MVPQEQLPPQKRNKRNVFNSINSWRKQKAGRMFFGKKKRGDSGMFSEASASYSGGGGSGDKYSAKELRKLCVLYN